MSFNLRCHVADTTDTTSSIMFSTLDSTNPVTCTVSGGAAVVGTVTDRHADGDYIGTGKVTITGLSASTRYTYTLSQGTESYQGSFKTAPSTQTEDFSFIFITCTNHQFAFSDVYPAIKNEIDNDDIRAIFHIDDVGYIDDMDLTNLNNLVDGTGDPQDTGLSKDFATAWACVHGHEPKFPIYTSEAFQYCLRNVPWYVTGGDHAIEYNHCRGQIGLGDYHGCNRGAGDAVPNLEPTAIAEWAAFWGDGNPATLGSGTDLHWGKELGAIRFANLDPSKYSTPYDGADTTQDYFGATQLGEVMTYLDVSDQPFKCMLMDTGFSRIGQPWREWFTTECDAWHANDLIGNNLDSTSGWFFGLCGDNHTVHAASLDGGTGTGFWWFCPGTTGGSASTNWVNTAAVPPQVGTKTGRIRFFKHKESGTKNFASYLKLTVYASETPKRIVCQAKDLRGGEIFSYELKADSGNDNQWTNTWSQAFGF